MTISINNLNDNSPSFTSSATFTKDENQTAIGTVEATDADGDTVTYSVSGTDASAVSINASSGVLTFNSAPDHETKTSYAITVTASDGTNTTDQSVIIEITDLNDSGPVFTIASSQNVNEQDFLPNFQSWSDYSVVTVTATDDVGDQDNDITYEIPTSGDARWFQLTGSNLHLKDSTDYENPQDLNDDNIYEFDITATNSIGSTVLSLSIAINNLDDEAPTCTNSSKIVTPDEEVQGFVIDVSEQLTSCSDADGFGYSVDLSENGNSVTVEASLSAVFDEIEQTITINVPDEENKLAGWTEPISLPNYSAVGRYTLYLDLIDTGGNSSNIQIDVIPQDLNDEAPGDTTSALNINLTEHPGPEPADWSTASTPLRYIATCVRDYDLLHDYTDITASISGTDASAFEIAPITSAVWLAYGTQNEDCSRTDQYVGRTFLIQPIEHQDYETNATNSYQLSLDVTDGTNSKQIPLTINVLNQDGVWDSSTSFYRGLQFRGHYAENETRVFNKNYQWDINQPWGIGTIVVPDPFASTTTKIIQISGLSDEQSVSSAWGEVQEMMAYLLIGIDDGGQYLEFKYHQFAATSPAASYGFTAKTYLVDENSNNSYESAWGIYVDFQGIANTAYGSSAFRVFLVDIDGTDVVDLMTHPDTTVSWNYNNNTFTTGAPNRDGYRVSWDSYNGTRDDLNVYWSIVTTTFMPDSLPDTDEIYMLITDPLRWLNDYKIGNPFRIYDENLSEAEQIKTSFALNDSDSAKSTQIYLPCNTSDWGFGAGSTDKIQNEVYPDEWSSSGAPLTIDYTSNTQSPECRGQYNGFGWNETGLDQNN